MAFHKRKTDAYHIKHSQNFIRSSSLACELVELSNISIEDLVLEIGPGKGALTQYIAKKTPKLTAIEKDVSLVKKLNQKIGANAEIISNDFLDYTLPKSAEYKVIGNIPFALTSKILRKLLDSKHCPEEIYLIMQSEAAFRFLGDVQENLFSLKYKPFYSGKIIKYLDRNDFIPVPNVDIVFVQIIKRKDRIISYENKQLYLEFINYCFTSWKKNLKKSLTKLFTANQLNYIEKVQKIKLERKPSELKFNEWVKLFDSFLITRSY